MEMKEAAKGCVSAEKLGTAVLHDLARSALSSGEKTHTR